MSRKQGTLKLSSNIEPRASAPLDARLVVPTLADLTTSGAFPYPYVGMIVSVQSEGKAYMLTVSDPTVSANWKEVGSGEGTLWADSPIGTILPYGGYSAPTGWFICNGAAISRTDYADLFDVIGTSFGSGDGSTTFNLPDLREATTKGVGLTGKSNNHYDSDGVALGEFVEDRIQNITGSLSPANDDCSFDMNMTGEGAIQATNGERMSITSPTEYSSWTGFTFDASRVARTGATTEVKAVGVNYIIKAMMVSAPADFMDAVEDAVAEVTPRVWVGSKDDWDELPLAEQVKYDEAHFTDDELTGQIVDAVTDGDMRAVTSNAVYDAFKWETLSTAGVSLSQSEAGFSRLNVRKNKMFLVIEGEVNTAELTIYSNSTLTIHLPDNYPTPSTYMTGALQFWVGSSIETAGYAYLTGHDIFLFCNSDNSPVSGANVRFSIIAPLVNS